MIWVFKPHAHRAHVIDAEPMPAPSILLLPQTRKTACGSSLIGRVTFESAELTDGEFNAP